MILLGVIGLERIDHVDDEDKSEGFQYDFGYGFCFVRISGIDVPAKGDVKAQENDATDFG